MDFRLRFFGSFIEIDNLFLFVVGIKFIFINFILNKEVIKISKFDIIIKCWCFKYIFNNFLYVLFILLNIGLFFFCIFWLFFFLFNFVNILGMSVIVFIKENVSEVISVLFNVLKVILVIFFVNMIGKNIVIVVNVDVSIVFVIVFVFLIV